MFTTKLKMKWWFISLLFLAFFLWRLLNIRKLSLPENQLVKMMGRVTKQPYLKGSYQIINVGPLLITTNRFPSYFYGDKLMVVGELKKQVINSFLTQYFAFFPTIQKIEEEKNLPNQRNFIKWLLKTRGQVEENLNQLLPEPHASLLLGVIFGVKSQMPENFWQNLRKTGTLHLVVASGQNVVLVSGFLMNVLLWFLKRKVAIFFSLLGILVYVLMVGAEAPAVRAGLMATMISVGQLFGREGNPGKFLLITAMLMLLISPLMLFDIGFQLSFAATAGLVWFYPFLKNKALNLAKIPLLGEGLLISLAAQATTLPLLWFNFGQFSWLSPLVNSLVLPIIPIVMILGTLLAGLSFFSKFLAQLLAWFVWPFLTWFIKVVDFFGQLSLGSLELGKISWLWLIGYYFLLGMILWRFYERGKSS